MSTGFIYIVASTKKDYTQKAFYNVPTPCGALLYFGACKKRMRPRMNEGDYIFGISSSKTRPRRIVFAARIDECINFAEAYHRYRELRGPEGPIHVQPIKGKGSFPRSHYEHIPGSTHRKRWERDFASPNLDRFFICCPKIGGLPWLGASGPEIDDEILAFLNNCDVFGPGSRTLGRNEGKKKNPIAFGRFFRGIHLETRKPKELLKLCRARINNERLAAEREATIIRQVGPTTLDDCAVPQSCSC